MVTNFLEQKIEVLLSLFLFYSFISEFHNIFVTGILRKVTTLIALYLLLRKWILKSCVLYRNFISSYKINRTLHGRLGIQILSSRAQSISHSFASLTREVYFQHSKIKFISPRGHVISSIYSLLLFFFAVVMLNKMKFSLRTFWNIGSFSCNDTIQMERGLWHRDSRNNFYNLLPVH